MARLVNNAAGVDANTSTGAGNASNVPVPVVNADPVFVERSLLGTLYASATDWGGASVQIFVTDQAPNSQRPIVWYPLVGALFTENGYFNFGQRWFQMKAEVTGATAPTAGLFCSIFGPP